jgi:tetratricopeptide (TPR) repeat protein
MKGLQWLMWLGLVIVALSTLGAARSRAQPAGTAPPQTSATDASPSTDSPAPVPTKQVAPARPTARDIHHQAVTFYQHQAYDDAAKLAEQGATQYPEASDLHADVGLARLAMNDYDAAVDALQRALVLEPKDPYYRLALGRAYYALRGYSRGRVAYARAIGLRESTRAHAYERYANYHVWMGDAYRTLGLEAEARGEYLRALELDPSDAYARTAARESFALQRSIAARSEREMATPETSSSRSAPHNALLLNPLALVVGAVTEVYSFGLELQAGGTHTAIDISPQIGFTGRNNSFQVPAKALGEAVLIGVRIGSGGYLDGWFFLPRIGPVHWGGDSWSFWATALELEVGYTLAAHDPPEAMGQIGVGVRALIPTQSQLHLPADLTADQGTYSISRSVKLRPMIGLMLDASLGVGWL